MGWTPPRPPNARETGPGAAGRELENLHDYAGRPRRPRTPGIQTHEDIGSVDREAMPRCRSLGVAPVRSTTDEDTGPEVIAKAGCAARETIRAP